MDILILRMSAIGDIIMASGILPVLKKAYPDSRICWVVQKEYVDLLCDSPYVDKLIPFDRQGISKSLKQGRLFNFFRQVFCFLRDIRKSHFDLVLDLQGIWKSSIWAALSKGAKKIVVDPKEGVGVLFSTKTFSNPRDKRIGAEYKVLLERLGIFEDNYCLGVGVSKENIDIYGEYVVFCPFTTREQKFWVHNYWNILQEYIEKKGYKVVVLGGPYDRDIFNKIFYDKDTIIDLVGKLSLKESFGVIKQAKAVIGVDTGLTHCGMLMKKPTIAIFGSTCPYLDTGYREGIVIYKNLSCSPCKRNPSCNGNFKCMQEITPNTVISHLEHWL